MELKPGPRLPVQPSPGQKVALKHRTGFWPSTDFPPLQKWTESRQQLQSCHYGGFMSEKKNKRAAKCFTALTTRTASLQQWDLSALSDSPSPQQPVCKRRECCLLSDAPSLSCSSRGAWQRVGFTVWLNANRHTHTENTRPVGRGSSTTLQPPSLPMHNAWEHVNTLFRTCINDHGEAHSLSTRAINKRWCTDKGPYLPSLENLQPTLPNHLIHWDTFHANS